MDENKRLLNVIFAVVILGLGAVAISSYFAGTDQAAVLEPSSPDVQGAGNLPENHPPLDAAEKLTALEQLSRNDPKNPDYKAQIGNVYYDMGSYQKAIEAYQESLRLRPQDPNVETDLATCFHFLGQHDKALELLNSVLEYQPNFPAALFNKGIVLQAGRSDPRGAMEAWELLLRTSPDHPQRAELEKRIRELKSVVK